ncbi:hypothetical protein AHAS_Ahas08G0091200 [Arachis hypogaea]
MAQRSVRVSTQEDDLVQRSTKKVKTREENTLPDVEIDSPNPEDKWYRNEDDHENNEKPFDPCPNIPVAKEEFEEWCKPWKNALMVKLLGKRVTFAFMEQRLRRDWEKKGKIHVIDMNRDYFLVHFADEEDYAHALLEGPWMITGHYLIVQRWRPFFLSGTTEIRKIAAWIRIPNLPIKLYNHRFLWRVGLAIGHMLKIDRTTSIHSRGKFASICVEIDLAKQLVPIISVLGCELHLEYEGLYQICFSCGKYGHRSEQCMDNDAMNGDPMEDNRSGENPQGEVPDGKVGNENGNATEPQDQRNHSNGKSNPDFGPWMMVQRYNNRKKPQVGKKPFHANQDVLIIYSSEEGNSPIRNNPNSGSRFNILQEENLESMHEDGTKYKESQGFLDRNGPNISQAQGTTTKVQVQTKTTKPGAGKNPQNQQKFATRPKPTIEPGKKVNTGKNKPKTPASSTARPTGTENHMEAAKKKEHNSELEGMEMVVNDYMRKIELERWDTFNTLKDSSRNLEIHGIRQNLLFNPDKQQQPMKERMESMEERGDQVGHIDVAMSDFVGEGTQSASSSRNQGGPMIGACSRKLI